MKYTPQEKETEMGHIPVVAMTIGQEYDHKQGDLKNLTKLVKIAKISVF